MTCIVAWIDEKTKKVTIGADSYWGGYYWKNPGWNKINKIKLHKIMKKNGSSIDIATALTGSGTFRINDIVTELTSIGKTYYDINDFVNSINKEINSFKKDLAKNAELNFTLMVVGDGHIYVVYDDYDYMVIDEKGYAIGAGGHNALVAMDTIITLNVKNMSSEDIARTALEVSENVCPHVKGPFMFKEI